MRDVITHKRSFGWREFHRTTTFETCLTVCRLSISNRSPSLLWVSLRGAELTNPKGKVTYYSSFITNLSIDKKNISELASCARARWKIENETFNVLKNNGYHIEHNFGHGKQTLSALLVVFNLLAFTMHNACDAAEALWQQAREVQGPRNTLFIHLWTISRYHVFHSWSALMMTIITGRAPPS